MKLLLSIVIVIFSLIYSVAKPHGFDDEGEISVPRSPKIQGPLEINLNYSDGVPLNNLECTIEGSPTPTVFWLKDEKEIQSGSSLYNTTYNVTEGKAMLTFTQTAYKSVNDVLGKFTCIAANFLGRVQKTFKVESTQNNGTNTTITEINTLRTVVTESTGSSKESNETDKTSPASRLAQILGAR